MDCYQSTSFYQNSSFCCSVLALAPAALAEPCPISAKLRRLFSALEERRLCEGSASVRAIALTTTIEASDLAGARQPLVGAAPTAGRFPFCLMQTARQRFRAACVSLSHSGLLLSAQRNPRSPAACARDAHVRSATREHHRPEEHAGCARRVASAVIAARSSRILQRRSGSRPGRPIRTSQLPAITARRTASGS